MVPARDPILDHRGRVLTRVVSYLPVVSEGAPQWQPRTTPDSRTSATSTRRPAADSRRRWSSPGRKWNAAILLAGVRGARRFSEYRAAVTGISDRLLAARLRELEAEGLIERHVRATTPVTISYTPSTDGLRLIELLQPLTEWGLEHHQAGEAEAARDGTAVA